MAEIKINMDSLKTYRKAIRHKVKEGSNIFRLLPPFGSACEGYPYIYWSVCWGLTDPSTGNSRPFADSKPYEQKSPVWDYLDLLRAKVESIKMDMMTKGASEEDIKVRLAETNKVISTLRPKGVYIWNAIDKSGTVGLLELKTTAHKALVKLMNQYILDYNQDPTSLGKDPSDSGVWFNFVRTGSSFDTEYNVNKNQTMVKDSVTGVPSYQDDRTAIPESIAMDYQNHGHDLTCVYQKKTYDELKEILISNIREMCKTNSDLCIPEFTGETAATIQVAPIANVPKGTAKVGIKLGNVESFVDEKELEVPASMAATPTTNSTEDLLKMADSIFSN